MSPYERARSAWRTVRLSPETFAAHVARVGASGEHAADLYLACACAAGDLAAIALLEEHYITRVPQWIERIDRSVAVAEEAKQRLREYLLVGRDGTPPRIADYAGAGPLAGWLRVAASRFVLQMKRSERRNGDSDADAAARLAACEPSPEVAVMRARHGAELAAALRAAIAALPEKERGLLKLAVVDELTIDELAVIYGVHRATVARWVARLKEQTFDAAVAVLRQRLDLDTAEAESLCRAVRSQLDFSLGSLLDET